jgi:ribosome maturation factor RimP
MIETQKIEKLVKDKLKDYNDMFLVEVKVNTGNKIQVHIDSLQGITIDQCVAVSRHIEGNLDRDAEDFELQVSSPGLSEPLRVREQYLKNIGRDVEVVLKDGSKLKGQLVEADQEKMVIEEIRMEKVEGKKKKQRIVKKYELNYDDVKSTTVVISFK